MFWPTQHTGHSTGVLKIFLEKQELELAHEPHHRSDGKESACTAGELGLIPGLTIFPGEGNGYSLQYSCLENSGQRSLGLQPMESQRVEQLTPT